MAVPVPHRRPRSCHRLCPVLVCGRGPGPRGSEDCPSYRTAGVAWPRRCGAVGGVPLTSDEEIRSREEPAASVRALHQECLSRGGEWNNSTLEDFLQALAAWMEDSPGWYRSAGEDLPDGGDRTCPVRALRAVPRYEGHVRPYIPQAPAALPAAPR
ncbi:DUF7660 family protein [Streptomyces nanhaiensis]